MRLTVVVGVILGLGIGGTARAQQVIGGCPVLPSNNIWNTRVDTLPVLSNSSAMVNTIGANRGFHADFGSGTWDGGPIGIPFITVTSGQPSYPASFRWPGESDPGPYAVPLNAPIEGGADATGDRHAIAVDTERCVLYELYRAFPQSSSWMADSGSIFDLKSNALRPSTWTSADAAGLPIMPGLVTYEEVLSGEIRHAIRFTAPQTRREFVWPARHFASSLTGSQYPRMGERFRLKATFDITPYPSEVQVILRAMKKYGVILADNGSAWYLSGKPDSRWNNDHLQTFGQLLGANLEAVDATVLMIDPNSGQALQAGKDLLVDFGPAHGIWTLYDGQTWAQLHALSPESMITGDLDGNGVDDAVIDFGSANGIWVHLNDASWFQLHALSPDYMVTADLDNTGKDDVVISFPGFGIYVWYNNATWRQLHALDSGLMAAGNIDGVAGDDAIIDFPGRGIWVFLNNSSWFRLHALDASAIVTGDLDGSGKDDVVIDFPGLGIWQFVNNAGWSKVHGLDASRLAVGDIDGNARDGLIIDFGSRGIWVFRNATWSQLHGLPSEGLALGDLDGDGRDEVVVDFGGSFGVWAFFNNSFWNQLHQWVPKSLQTGQLNRRP